MKLSLSKRIRNTPFSKFVQQNNPKEYTVYNHMLLPTVYNSLEEDYFHLKSNVQVWDVSVQRQIQISGPDAMKLIKIIIPRDLSKSKFNQCYYAPIVDDKGKILNDPLILMLNENTVWISIADSDILFFLKGISIGFNLNVKISELNIYPLAIQGPKSSQLLKKIFGKEIKELNFFKCKKLKLKNYDFLISKSGFSKQGGFEIYVIGDERVDLIWNILFEAGKEFNLKAGCPNLIERIEGGLLSYGNDMDSNNTPFECNFDKLFNLNLNKHCIASKCLEEERVKGISKRIKFFKIFGNKIKKFHKAENIIFKKKIIGKITSAIFSPSFNTNVAIGMVDTQYMNNQKDFKVNYESELLECEVFDNPLI